MSDGGSGLRLILMEAEQREINAACALNDDGWIWRLTRWTKEGFQSSALCLEPCFVWRYQPEPS